MIIMAAAESYPVPEITTLEVLETLVVGCGVVTVTLTGPLSWSKLSIIVVYIFAVFTQFLRRPERLAAKEGWVYRKNSRNGVVVGSLLFMMVSQGFRGEQCQGFGPPHDCNVVHLMFLNLLMLLVCCFPGLGRPWIVMGETIYAIGGFMFVGSIVQGMPSPVNSLVDMFIFYPNMTMMTFSVSLMFLPGSLTAGEALFLTQLVTVLTRLPLEPIFTNSPQSNLVQIRKVLITACMHIVIVLKHVLYKLHTINKAYSEGSIDKGTANKIKLKWSMYFYLVICGEILLFEVPRLYFVMGQNPFLWVLDFILADRKRIVLMNIWVILLAIGVAVVIYNQTSSTQVRKIFHILAVAVFIPGIYLDPQLLLMAATGLTCLFILTECIRIFRVQPYGNLIHDTLTAFIDEQDSGIAIVTPIFLLLGLYQPMSYMSDAMLTQYESKLLLYSGVLSLGIGDTAASVIGSKYGSVRWPGSKKTVEGTLAAIISQLLACVFLSSCLGTQPSFGDAWPSITWVIVLTSLLEAFTLQIDNLVLPSFMMSLFLAIS